MALRLRQYKPCDADIIAGWIKDEESLVKWSSDRFGGFPLAGETINRKYIDNNGGCEDPENFYPMTAFDENGIAGSLTLRYTDFEAQILRFGFIIVDDAKRGMGYGKEMLLLALKYAFEILKAEKVTLGVFENNPPAYYCYKAAGFSETGEERFFEFSGERLRIIEMAETRETYEKSRAARTETDKEAL